MADTTTGLPVRTVSGEFIFGKLVDTGGTNVAAVSAAGRLSVDASGIAVPITDNAGSLTVDAPVGTPVYVRLSDGAANLIGQKAMAASVPVVIASDQSAVPVTVSGVSTAANQTSVQIVDNAAFTDGTTTLLMGGYIFDNVAGTALTENDAAAARIDSKRAQVFVLEDGTTRNQPASVSAAGALKVDGSAVTQPISGTVTANSGTGFPASLGQKAMAASFAVVIASDQAAFPVTPAANSSVNVNQIVGAAPSATNPLPVRLADGAAFYSASSGAPVSPQSNRQTSAALGAGASVDLDYTAITNAKTGQLMGVDVSSAVNLKIEIKTVNNAGTATTVITLFSLAGQAYSWRTAAKAFLQSVLSTGTAKFRTTLTNMSAVASDVYGYAQWDEI